MNKSSELPTWLKHAKLCLGWFVDAMGRDEWSKRRFEVVSYFNSLNANTSSMPRKRDALDYKPLAVYDDWIGWYMYLVECLMDRPECDEPMQSARIYPVFAAIGRHLDLLKRAGGIEDRLAELLSAKRNQPDSTLFELIVAACYRKNGWKVQFLKEAPQRKTPDFLVERRGVTLFVECKRFAKTTEYAERERQEWLKRWNVFVDSIDDRHPAMHFKITFKKPIEATDLGILKTLYSPGDNFTERSSFSIENEEILLISEKINMAIVDAHFEEYDVRCASPQMIDLLAGNFSPFRNYTQKIFPKSILQHGKDDGLHAFNLFFGGIYGAFSAEWKCIADEAISAKAKDVKKMLSKAVSQLPHDLPSVVHIGYETLSGPLVEFERHDRTMETIGKFNYGSKNIQLIFLNALQCAPSSVERFECAETALIYRRQGGLNPDNILPNMLLLDQDDTEASDTTHWKQDFDNVPEWGQSPH